MIRLGWLGRARREPKVGERLPYARLLDERTLLLRDGALMQALHLQGFAFETADTEELNHRCQARDAALRAISDSRLVIHHHVIRRKVEAELAGEFDDPVCRHLDERWRERMSGRRLFVNDLFITLLRRPAKGKSGWVERIGALFARGLGAAEREAATARDLRELEAAREALASALAPYGPRVLVSYETSHGLCSEPLELLSAICNGEMRPVQVPAGDVGDYIPYKRIAFGGDALELKGPADRSFAAILSLKEYPPHAAPGMTDELLRLPHEMVLSESFAFVERQTGAERVSLALRRFRAADDDAESLRRGLMEAKDDLASGRSALGEHHLSLLVRAETLEGLDRAAAECASALADLGAVAVREELNLEAAYWAQFPGNEAFIARKALISTGAYAGFASFHGFPIGQAADNWWGPAVTLLETTSATPYFFNFHRGDLGNFTVIGPSGSGKTVALNFLTAQAQKIRPRTVFFDKDRGAELFLRAIGGCYAALRPGEPTGFNPLQLPGSPADRAFLRDWAGHLVRQPGEALSPEDEAAIAAAVEANYDQEIGYRRLRYFQELLGGMRRPRQGDLSSRLTPWIGKGEHAWLFDNAADRLDMRTRILGFDMTAVLEAPQLRTPAMMYLFHRVEERLDGEPTMILIDEGWKALDDEVFAQRIRDWMKTLRKRNAILGFGTQSARDALDSRIAAAIIEQAATQIFMPNPRAQEKDYCEGFGLSGHELELIRALPPQAHAFLVKHGDRSIVARLELADAPDIVKLLSGRESTVRRLDELRQRFGDRPRAWWPHLMGTPYPAPPEPEAPLEPRLRLAR
jgi:type IV secretion system protein VirB4